MPAPWLRDEWRPAPDTTIVFVHGAVVNGLEMGLLRWRLAQLGYRVRQFHYHSLLLGLAENAQRLARFLAATKGTTLHIVGHSMGGVLIRRVFEQTPDLRPGRLVAIGSPLLDCWIGHRISGLHNRASCLVGKTVHEHITGPRDPVWRGARDFGVVAGTYAFGIGCLFPNLPSPSDGVVLWDETRLQGARDHRTFPLNHFGLLLSRRVAAEVARFLATGSFAER